jgi:hypothetical protein
VHLGNANAVAVTAVRHAQQANAARQTQPAPPVQRTPTPIPVQPLPAPTPVQQPAPAPTPTVPTPEPTPALVPAQGVADAQANASQAATDAAVDHVAAAIEANQQAAQNTADAAQNAQTEIERQQAAESAAKVLEREKKIAEAIASLGLGQCGVRTYKRITERAKNALLVKLRAEGMAVTGDNPWNINTNQYDVKLRAVWDPTAQEVKLIVTTGKGGYFGAVTCPEIWKKIDPIMKEVI